jgi:hypothetical protein
MAKSIVIDYKPVNTIRINEKKPIRASFKTGNRISLVNEVLPFRIRFTAVQIPGITGAVPPIPLQIIGYSNYIL